MAAIEIDVQAGTAMKRAEKHFNRISMLQMVMTKTL